MSRKMFTIALIIVAIIYFGGLLFLINDYLEICINVETKEKIFFYFLKDILEECSLK